MKKRLLFENIVYRTRLTEEQVIARLAESLVPYSFYSTVPYSIDKSKPYVGVIRGNTFKFERIIYFPYCLFYFNPFLPDIIGKICEDRIGTRIYINIKVRGFITIFMPVWLSCIASVCIGAILFILIAGGYDPVLPVLFIVLVLCSTYPVWAFKAFKYESTKSKNSLLRILEAYIEEVR